MNCYLFTEPVYLIFSPDSLPELLYYSHLSSALIAILVGLFIFFNGRRFLLNKLLFLITITFFLWVFSNLITWTNVDSGFILVAWTSFEILSAILSILCIYFVYVFLFKEDVSFKLKNYFFAPFAPSVIFCSDIF